MAKKVQRSNMTLSDSKGNILRKPKETNPSEGRFSWWAANNDTDMAMQVASTLNFISRHQSARMEQLTVSTRLYGNTSAFSLMGSAFTRASAVAPSPSSQRISYNLCSSVVDTLTAQLSKNKIIPTFITSGGKWGMQRKAENLSKFLDGCFYENKIHRKAVEAANDSGCWGDGIVYVYRSEDDRAVAERVLPHELFIDQVESMVTRPSQIHRVKICDRDVLKGLFKDDKEALAKIDSAMPANMQDVSGVASAADLITVTESWHLPSYKGADDGCHIICLEDKVLTPESERKYDKDYFPFAFLQYKKRKLGFWGQGAVERLQNLQGEINRLMILIQKSMWLGGSFKVLLENGSKVVSQHINNDVGAIIHYVGTPPQYITPPMIQQDIYPYVDALIAKGYQQEGVSQMASSNVKPLGVDSGEALRTYDKIGDDRQLEFGQEFEQFHLEIGRQMIEVVKDIYKDTKHYKVTWPGTSFIQSIDWGDVNLEKDEYVLKSFPTSSLPDEPMAKLQTVQEYMQAGLVSPRAGRRLMRTEDIEMSDMLANAAEDLICKTIEDIIYDKKDDVRPDSNWDLQLAKQISLEYYNFALVNSCPEENMNLLRQFQGYIDDELGLTAPPPAPTVTPQANPNPTPQSNLVPNVNSAPTQVQQ
jgi:hypothetical protein